MGWREAIDEWSNNSWKRWECKTEITEWNPVKKGIWNIIKNVFNVEQDLKYKEINDSNGEIKRLLNQIVKI